MSLRNPLDWRADALGVLRSFLALGPLGDDANDGLSPENPLKTIEKGFGLLRDGHSDWLLLKRGDVWYESIGSITSGRLKNGRSPQQPTCSPERRKKMGQYCTPYDAAL